MAITTAPSLRRDITAALVLKLALLAALYLLFFRWDQRPDIDADAAARHLIAPFTHDSDSEVLR